MIRQPTRSRAVPPRFSRFAALGFAALTALALTAPGCRTAPDNPDYARALPAGAAALAPVTGPRRDLILQEAADQLAAPDFVEALGRSADWFRLPSTPQFFPLEGVTHDRARRSVEAILDIAESSPDPAIRNQQLAARFDVFQSVGYDGSGVVLYTGYFSPQFSASRTRTGPYQFPLYKRPPDLVTDPTTGVVLGRRSPAGTTVPYPTRMQIESADLLSGMELVFLPSRLDAYTIEVNGSARLTLRDGSILHVGYAGTNGREYTSIGRLLVAQNKLDPDTVSMPTIRRYFQENPAELNDLIRQNERFVFFKEYPGGDWPAGSLGFRVTPERSLATDKKIFPRGGVVLVSTTLPDGSPYRQLMLDQDTGGAIRAPGRADLYFGIGPRAQQLSGAQAAEGRLFYLFLKP
ncbi:MAG: MltA domain-containing protein [Planctomycetota bacterium]